MKLKDIGEFGLIEKLKKHAATGTETIIGIGDDTAVLASPHKGMLILLTTDMLVEGVHFDLSKANPHRIGWKALGCSLSDIAAMGGLPRAAVVSLGASADVSVECCMEIYRGINDLARRFNCGVVGGDTVRHNGGIVISVSVMGEVERERVALRSGARPGDTVWVTGRLGGSIKERHLSFIPRIEEARFLTEHFSIRAMMDLSDGLGSDLYRIAEASRVGFRIERERLPVNADASGDLEEEAAIHAALYDGEDFELLFTLPTSDNEKDFASAFSSRFDCGVSRIGTVMEPEHGVTLIGPEGERPLREGGFSHFE
jgi:thiamine-monophosphate kinase